MKVSEFLKTMTGKNVSCLRSGSECELIGEVAYCLQDKGIELELDIDVLPEISKLYIDRMVDLGVKWGNRVAGYYASSNFLNKERRNFDRLVITRTVTDWIFNREESIFVNSMVDVGRGKGYIPLLAYFMVDKFITNSSGKLKLVGSCTPENYQDLFVLLYCGNRLVEDIVEIENSDLGQAEWYAYIACQMQCNRMNKSVDSVVKYNWFKDNDVQKGDVMLLYTIGSDQDKTRRELKSCFIAVLDYIEKDSVSMTVITSIETVMTQVYRVSSANFKDTSLSDYYEFNTRKQKIPFTSLGVEYNTYDEEYMLMKPTTDDGSMQLMVMPDDNGNWDIQKVEMDTLDTIYAVLENRGIKYNRDRFLQEYFISRGVVPIYERYREHQPTEYENSTKQEILRKYGG